MTPNIGTRFPSPSRPRIRRRYFRLFAKTANERCASWPDFRRRLLIRCVTDVRYPEFFERFFKLPNLFSGCSQLIHRLACLVYIRPNGGPLFFEGRRSASRRAASDAFMLFIIC